MLVLLDAPACPDWEEIINIACKLWMQGQGQMGQPTDEAAKQTKEKADAIVAACQFSFSSDKLNRHGRLISKPSVWVYGTGALPFPSLTCV